MPFSQSLGDSYIYVNLVEVNLGEVRFKCLEPHYAVTSPKVRQVKFPLRNTL